MRQGKREVPYECVLASHDFTQLQFRTCLGETNERLKLARSDGSAIVTVVLTSKLQIEVRQDFFGLGRQPKLAERVIRKDSKRAERGSAPGFDIASSVCNVFAEEVRWDGIKVFALIGRHAQPLQQALL